MRTILTASTLLLSLGAAAAPAPWSITVDAAQPCPQYMARKKLNAKKAKCTAPAGSVVVDVSSPCPAGKELRSPAGMPRKALCRVGKATPPPAPPAPPPRPNDPGSIPGTTSVDRDKPCPPNTTRMPKDQWHAWCVPNK